MYTSHIGRIFLRAYNEREKTSYHAQEFFNSVFWKLFFDSPKYMMYVTNSTFVQSAGTKSSAKYNTNDAEARLRLKHNFNLKITGDETYGKEEYRYDPLSLKGARDASTCIGYPALDLTQPTNSMVTSMTINIPLEDAYLSWIGAALGIGTQDNYCFYIDHPPLLLDLFDGWSEYRKQLDQTPTSGANQINTWNGRWICSRYADMPLTTDLFNGKEGKIAIAEWSSILFSIAKRFPDAISYVSIFSIGQTVTTLGIIPLRFPEFRRYADFYAKSYTESGESSDAFKELIRDFKTAFRLEKAVERGHLGLAQLKPREFAELFERTAKDKTKSGSEFGKRLDKSDKDEEIKKNIQFTIAWIKAMINNDTMLNLTEKFAGLLANNFLDNDNRTKYQRMKEEVLDAGTKTKFVEAITDLIKEDNRLTAESVAEITQMIGEVHKIPTDVYYYFRALLKYYYLVSTKFTSNKKS